MAITPGMKRRRLGMTSSWTAVRRSQEFQSVQYFLESIDVSGWAKPGNQAVTINAGSQ